MTASSEHIHETSMTDLWNVWFTEMHRRRVGLSIKIKELLYSGTSPYQRIDILDSYEFGRLLVLYGSIMVTEKDEFIYHEMLSHVPLFSHPNPKRVLIIGGGDGGTLREVLRHKGVTATMVEIDEMVVQTAKEYLPTIATDFKNPRAQVLFEDGERFVANCKEKFDVILVDASDPVGPAEVLFQKAFHEQVARCLSRDGIFVTQSESPFFHQKTLNAIQKNLRDIFSIVRVYLANIPTYPSGLWSFTFCSNRVDPVGHFKETRVRAAKFKTKYYNANIHRGAFALPSFLEEDGADLGL